MISTLYLAQGLPFGFFIQALPVVMRSKNYSLQLIGLSSLLALPWGAKFLWAAPFDRYGSARFGRRKSFIVPLQLLTVLLLLALAWIGDTSMTVILAAVFLVNLLAATQDVATDGLAIDLLEPEERGLANGVQVAGYRVGMILGGGALLAIYARLEWRGTFLAMAAIVLLTTIPILFFREPPRREEEQESAPPEPSFFLRKNAPRILALVFSYKIGAYLMQTMLRPFLVDRGMTTEDIAVILGTVGFTAGLAGAMTGGALLRWISRRSALILFGSIQAVTVLAFAFLARGPIDSTVIAIAAACEHFAGGLATTALFTSMMDWSSRRSASNDYTIQASTVIIATSIGSALSGYTAEAFGYAVHFGVAAGVVLMGAVLAGLLFPRDV